MIYAIQLSPVPAAPHPPAGWPAGDERDLLPDNPAGVADGDDDGIVFSFAIAGFVGSTASTANLSLRSMSPSVTVGSSGPVVMTATVAPSSGSGTPTGVVAFFNGSSELGSLNLSGGAATFDYNPSSLALNPYPITAIYSGTTRFATSTSSRANALTMNSLPAVAMPTFSPRRSGEYRFGANGDDLGHDDWGHDLLHQRRDDTHDGLRRVQRADHG